MKIPCCFSHRGADTVFFFFGVLPILSFPLRHLSPCEHIRKDQKIKTNNKKNRTNQTLKDSRRGCVTLYESMLCADERAQIKINKHL